MVNQELLTYIKQQLNQNISKEDIVNVLLETGWSQQDINEAFAEINAPQEKEVQEEAPQQKSEEKDTPALSNTLSDVNPVQDLTPEKKPENEATASNATHRPSSTPNITPKTSQQTQPSETKDSVREIKKETKQENPIDPLKGMQGGIPNDVPKEIPKKTQKEDLKKPSKNTQTKEPKAGMSTLFIALIAFLVGVLLSGGAVFAYFMYLEPSSSEGMQAIDPNQDISQEEAEQTNASDTGENQLGELLGTTTQATTSPDVTVVLGPEEALFKLKEDFEEMFDVQGNTEDLSVIYESNAFAEFVERFIANNTVEGFETMTADDKRSLLLEVFISLPDTTSTIEETPEDDVTTLTYTKTLTNFQGQSVPIECSTQMRYEESVWRLASADCASQ